MKIYSSSFYICSACGSTLNTWQPEKGIPILYGMCDVYGDLKVDVERCKLDKKKVRIGMNVLDCDEVQE